MIHTQVGLVKWSMASDSSSDTRESVYFLPHRCHHLCTRTYTHDWGNLEIRADGCDSTCCPARGNFLARCITIRVWAYNTYSSWVGRAVYGVRLKFWYSKECMGSNPTLNNVLSFFCQPICTTYFTWNAGFYQGDIFLKYLAKDLSASCRRRQSV